MDDCAIWDLGDNASLFCYLIPFRDFHSCAYSKVEDKSDNCFINIRQEKEEKEEEKEMVKEMVREDEDIADIKTTGKSVAVIETGAPLDGSLQAPTAPRYGREGAGSEGRDGVSDGNEFGGADKLIKIKKRVNNKIAFTKGGFNSYIRNQVLLGDISHFFVDSLVLEIAEVFKNKVLDQLDEGRTYSILLYVKYIHEGVPKASTPMKSIIITKNINIYLVLQRIRYALSQFENEYQLSNYSGKCFVC